MNTVNVVLGILFVAICVLLIVVVLLQKGRGGGLGAAFGGAGSSAFGTRTGDVFTWITIVLTGLFLLMAIGTGLAFRPKTSQVLKPEFSPEAGPITGPIQAMISCPTQGSKISYTVDGTDPVKDKAVAGPVPATVLPGQTLRAQAFRAEWEPSTITEMIYELKVPTTVPAVAPAEVPAVAPAEVPAMAPATQLN